MELAQRGFFRLIWSRAVLAVQTSSYTPCSCLGFFARSVGWLPLPIQSYTFFCTHRTLHSKDRLQIVLRDLFKDETKKKLRGYTRIPRHECVCTHRSISTKRVQETISRESNHGTVGQRVAGQGKLTLIKKLMPREDWTIHLLRLLKGCSPGASDSHHFFCQEHLCRKDDMRMRTN